MSGIEDIEEEEDLRVHVLWWTNQVCNNNNCILLWINNQLSRLYLWVWVVNDIYIVLLFFHPLYYNLLYLYIYISFPISILIGWFIEEEGYHNTNICLYFTFIIILVIHLLQFRWRESIRILDDDDLEALSVDDGWSRLVVLFLRDPHLLEGR